MSRRVASLAQSDAPTWCCLPQEETAISGLVAAEAPDVLCLQETKLQDQHCEGVQEALGLPTGWHVSWNCSQAAKGYSGTAIFSRRAPQTTPPRCQAHWDHNISTAACS